MFPGHSPAGVVRASTAPAVSPEDSFEPQQEWGVVMVCETPSRASRSECAPYLFFQMP